MANSHYMGFDITNHIGFTTTINNKKNDYEDIKYKGYIIKD